MSDNRAINWGNKRTKKGVISVKWRDKDKNGNFIFGLSTTTKIGDIRNYCKVRPLLLTLSSYFSTLSTRPR